MKRFLIIAAFVILIAPLSAQAQLTESEFWAEHRFLYRFTFVLRANVLEQVGTYEFTTGDEPFGTGPWQLVILGPHGQSVTQQSFTLMNGMTDVLVRYQPNGTTAQVVDPEGNVALTVDLSVSRICNENQVCESQYGEVSNNCPADCGSYAVAGQTAVISEQTSVSKRIGALLMGLALAVTGVLLFRGIGGILDRRYRP